MGGMQHAPLTSFRCHDWESPVKPCTCVLRPCRVSCMHRPSSTQLMALEHSCTPEDRSLHTHGIKRTSLCMSAALSMQQSCPGRAQPHPDEWPILPCYQVPSHNGYSMVVVTVGHSFLFEVIGGSDGSIRGTKRANCFGLDTNSKRQRRGFVSARWCGPQLRSCSFIFILN